MTGSEKVYSAPRLESLDLRATRDINITINGPGGSHATVDIGFGTLIS